MLKGTINNNIKLKTSQALYASFLNRVNLFARFKYRLFSLTDIIFNTLNSNKNNNGDHNIKIAPLSKKLRLKS